MNNQGGQCVLTKKIETLITEFFFFKTMYCKKLFGPKGENC